MGLGRAVKIGAAITAALFVPAVLTVAAHADDTAEESVRIDYTAPNGCPSSASFVTSVRARTTRMRLADASEPARTFVVALVDSARGTSGRVTIRALDGRELHREVRGRSCAEVADTLALVVALAIDPRASLTPMAPVEPAPAAIPSTSAVSSSASASSALPPTAPPQRSPPIDRPSIVTRPEAPRPRFRFALGVGGALSSGVTPSTLIGLAVFGELHATDDSWRAPWFRLALERAASDTVAEPGGSARFVWTVARADACVRGWRLGPLGISPCARIEGGSLFVQGGGVDRPRSDTRASLAVGPAIHFRLPIGDSLFFDADAALRVTILRDAFFFEPLPPFYDEPALGLGGGIGFGAVF